eukprot:725267-Amphidinium_carterae.1
MLPQAYTPPLDSMRFAELFAGRVAQMLDQLSYQRTCYLKGLEMDSRIHDGACSSKILGFGNELLSSVSVQRASKMDVLHALQRKNLLLVALRRAWGENAPVLAAAEEAALGDVLVTLVEQFGANLPAY